MEARVVYTEGSGVRQAGGERNKVSWSIEVGRWQLVDVSRRPNQARKRIAVSLFSPLGRSRGEGVRMQVAGSRGESSGQSESVWAFGGWAQGR